MNPVYKMVLCNSFVSSILITIICFAFKIHEKSGIYSKYTFLEKLLFCKSANIFISMSFSNILDHNKILKYEP